MCDSENAFLADLQALAPDLDESADLQAAAPAQSAEFDARAPLRTAADAVAYMLGGKATVTLVSQKTGARFTYRVNVNDDQTAWFVGLLNGPDNTADYKYLGRIAARPGGRVFWAGRKVPRAGDISRDAPSSRAFAWAWAALAQGRLPDLLEVWHEGRCGRCNRKLTVPESIAQGFGPECIDKLFS